MDNDIIKKITSELETVKSAEMLENLWRAYFGKDGAIKQMLKGIGKLPTEQRKIEGERIQKINKQAESLFKEKETQLSAVLNEKRFKEEAEELGYSTPKIGHLHPITRTIRELNELFRGMGYSIMDGPEIETDEYCFKRLNVPADHPARDMQDTIYIEEPNFLLRTQTSSIEAHVLEDFTPPFKVVCPGRVYRNEKANKSNHFIFHHYQGIVVTDSVSLKDVFGTFTHLFRKMYGADTAIRYRNKYYPEVEPGIGPDMQCFNCRGKGCTICKNVGWIEMGGAGIIHPNIMDMAGIDRKKWMGFAFALGLDRWVMAKYNITDIRTLLGGNLGYKYYENENTL